MLITHNIDRFLETCKINISERMRNVRKVFNEMKTTYHTMPKDDVYMRRKIFLAYALPHFLWLFCIWFFFTDKKKEQIEHVFCLGLKLVYSLNGWDDFTTLVLSQEKSLRDYL